MLNLWQMANLPKKFLKNREISELINGDNSELDSDGNDNDSDLDDEHASFEYTVEPFLLPTTTWIQRDIAVDTEQPLHQFTEKLNIKRRRIPFEPHPVIFPQPTLKYATPAGTPDGMAKFGCECRKIWFWCNSRSTIYTLASAYPHLGARYPWTSTSYQILDLLKTKGTNAAGTIRVNSFTKPPVMKKKERGYSDEVISHDGRIVIVKCVDNRLAHIASNFVEIGEDDTVVR
jgi:hypothetical protein